MFTLYSNPTKGELYLVQNGTFTYTPDVNYSGSDSFSYRVFDGSDSYQYNYSIKNWEWQDTTSGKDLSSTSSFTEAYSTYGTYQINMQITSTFGGFANSTSFNFYLNITTDTSLPPSDIPLSENGGLALPPQIPQ